MGWSLSSVWVAPRRTPGFLFLGVRLVFLYCVLGFVVSWILRGRVVRFFCISSNPQDLRRFSFFCFVLCFCVVFLQRSFCFVSSYSVSPIIRSVLCFCITVSYNASRTSTHFKNPKSFPVFRGVERLGQDGRPRSASVVFLYRVFALCAQESILRLGGSFLRVAPAGGVGGACWHRFGCCLASCSKGLGRKN